MSENVICDITVFLPWIFVLKGSITRFLTLPEAFVVLLGILLIVYLFARSSGMLPYNPVFDLQSQGMDQGWEYQVSRDSLRE